MKNAIINTVNANLPTYKEIGEHFGIDKTIVTNYLKACVKTEKAKYVKEYALEHGFELCEDGTVRSPRRPNCRGKRNGTKKLVGMTDYLDHSNFPSKNTETERMERLRKQGYTNAEIAEAVGKNYQTVLKRIGKQPVCFTNASFDLKGKIKALKAEARTERVALLKKEEITRQIAQVQNLIDKRVAYLKEINEVGNKLRELTAKKNANECDIIVAQDTLLKLKAM